MKSYPMESAKNMDAVLHMTSFVGIRNVKTSKAQCLLLRLARADVQNYAFSAGNIQSVITDKTTKILQFQIINFSQDIIRHQKYKF